jgi:hypothetical protein
MRFHTTIEQAGRTATGIRAPEDVVSELGSGKRPEVDVDIELDTAARGPQVNDIAQRR